MDRKSHPFSSLTESELDAIISRAQRERAEMIVSALVWLGRLLRALLITPMVRLWSAVHPSTPARKALHH